MSGVFLRLGTPKRNNVCVSLSLEPNRPLFLKVNHTMQGPFQSKPRISWVLGYTWCIFFHFRKIHISSMRSLGFSSPGVDAKVDEGTTSWWQALGHQGWLSKRRGYCTKPFWGVGAWDFLENYSYPNSVVSLYVIFSGEIVHPNTSMNSIFIPTYIYPQITN